MIVIIGTPVGRRTPRGVLAAGLPVAIARAAVVAGGRVQLVGRVPDGPEGDAVLLSVATDGIGHAAVLRDAGPDVMEEMPPDVDDGPIDELAGLDGASRQDSAPDGNEAVPASHRRHDLDPDDLTLALRYLPDYRVVVVAETLSDVAFASVADVARWAEVQLVVIAAPGRHPEAIVDTATILEAPAAEADGAFADMVGRYAAGLDQGLAAADAFAAASDAAGWSAVAD